MRHSNMIIIDRPKINVIASLIITGLILTLLIMPVWLLWKLTRGARSEEIMGIIIMVLLLFTLAFSVVLSLFTRAERHEILASAAA
jgi:hypothetical protein